MAWRMSLRAEGFAVWSSGSTTHDLQLVPRNPKPETRTSKPVPRNPQPV